MASEYQKAAQWREARNLSREQLGTLTGYSAQAIYWFERGETPPNRNHKSGSKSRAIKEWIWRRYRNTCAGIEYQMQRRKPFAW